MNPKRVGLGLLAAGLAALAAKRLRSNSAPRTEAESGQDAGPHRAHALPDEISTSLTFEAEDDIAATSSIGDAQGDIPTSIPPMVSLPTAELPETPSDKTPNPAAAAAGLIAKETPIASAASSEDLLAINIPTIDGGIAELPETPAPKQGMSAGVPALAGVASTVRPAASKVTLPDFVVPEIPPVAQAAPPTPPPTTPDSAALAGKNDGTGSKSPSSLPMPRSAWGIAGSALIGLFVVAGIVMSFVHLPYYRFDPGQVYDTVDRVSAPDDLVFEPEDGNIGFVTVAQTANITVWQWLDAKLDSGVRLEHRDLVEGDQTTEEVREEDRRRMQVSKNAAVVVALNELGYELIVTPIGIEVAGVFPCTAADGTLGTGDLIIGINGNDVRESEQFIAELAEIGIGQEVELMVDRIDPNNPTQSIRTETVNLTLGSADDNCLPDDVRVDEPRPFIGIEIFPIFDEQLPIEVDIETGRVGGPSAGLAFTLAVLDVMSDGELTNGLNVVVTGTIERDGRVGPVGGIHQKTIAAERSGADVFIVPMCCDNFVDPVTGEPLDVPTNYEEALIHTDEMMIIGVDTLDDAIEALVELGGELRLTGNP